MNREPLYRGKRVDNGKWIEGSFVHYSDCDGAENWLIYTHNGHPNAIIPETVCEYTGLTDKNGKQIFEGDIMKLKSGGGVFCFNSRDFIGVVKQEQFGGLRCDLCRLYVKTINDEYNEADFRAETMEVIGNIHDNPELLGGEV